MDRRTLRALAAGMTLSALVMLMVAYYSPEGADSSFFLNQDSDLVTLTEKEHEELQNKIAEWENQEENTIPSEEQSTQKQNEPETGETSSEQTEIMTRFILVIEPGMTSPEISEQLSQKDIIKDENSFNNYLTDHNLTDRIQIGEYDLNSTQSIEEIVNLITN